MSGSGDRARPESRFGREIYERLLPGIYRERDGSGAAGGPSRPGELGDLGRLVDAFGTLLDRLHATVAQRLADCFPDEPVPPADGEPPGLASQPWLLPYFADLVGARLLSPDAPGRRHEVARAVAWRKGKGTLAVVEEIAEAVGQTETEVQEGWRRVAVTPRLAVPRQPLATVDLRRSGRAVGVGGEDAARPDVRTSRFLGVPALWRLDHPAGAPCFPGSFEDASARTADLRNPDSRRGHAHPRRLLLHLPPPGGVFEPRTGAENGPAAEPIPWADREAHPELLEVTSEGSRLRVRGLVRPPVRIAGPVAPPTGVEELALEGVAVVSGGIAGDDGGGGGARLVLERVAAERVTAAAVAAPGPAEPGSPPPLGIDARSCLFESVEAPGLLARLEFVTVLGPLEAASLQASESLFVGAVDVPAAARGSCVRFSRVPAELLETLPAVPWLAVGNTAATPRFVELDVWEGDRWHRRPARFGEPGWGVLHPEGPRSVCRGAEDGGEMGAYHGEAHCLRAAAVIAKLEDFLPVGVRPVLVVDPRLRHRPPVPGAGGG